ncbi:unnamed protein product [Darwinula stevensoni]|uniref:Acetolactate synthase n=1 Tax=Darwinula stevensoni TaxID=69355 RepID=A0A7R9A9T2_9CRUS|nr:unnamed protein product [Darwinula stevensoni]CAG0897660.1 unnamed protein product [Darwinula stevensoni]
MFTLVGGHISPILVAAERLGIRVIDTRHEVSAVFAADPVARLSGKIGVAAVTAGPGLTNIVTAIKNAQMAESPVLLMGGAAANLWKGRGALQDIEQLKLFAPICKFTATVTSLRDIVPTLRKAIQIAQSGTSGPVFVEFPIDTLYPYEDVSKEFANAPVGKGLQGKIASWYLNNYLANLFAGAFEQRDISPLPVDIPMPVFSVVEKAVDMVKKSKKPLLIIGSQCMLPPTSVRRLKAAVESMGIPCYLGGMARGLLGRDSSIQMRHSRRDALREADCIILAGAVCDFRLSYGRGLNRRAN